jgi:hypothetical protein
VSPWIAEFQSDQVDYSNLLFTWPTEYEGKKLMNLPLSDKERLFNNGFPGEIRRFTNGEKELIIRRVATPTRKLHPATDCFKGIGYHIKPLPINFNQQQTKMGCFVASKQGNQALKVCEYIESIQGRSWSDVSSWYWNEVFKPEPAGYLSVVVAEVVE